MKKINGTRKHNSAAMVQRYAQERADNEARRIPWQRLLDSRGQYLEWQEFYLWVRSVLEVEDCVPGWLAEILNNRCPGFLEHENELTPRVAKERPCCLRLEDWIDDHVFGCAKEDGWFNAITFYAVREPRYQRAQVCWLQCVEQWKQAKPIRYPSFDEWKCAASKCDDTAHLLPSVRRARACSKLVAADRLGEAVLRYMDWEAFAYWSRSALELAKPLPSEVSRELAHRCPGFLESINQAKKEDSRSIPQGWYRLMQWIGEHFFSEARAEGWFDAILIQAQSHPRAIRTMEYWQHCDEIWDSKLPRPFPSLETWRQDADSYVDLDDN